MSSTSPTISLTANPNNGSHLGHGLHHPSYLQMPPKKTRKPPPPPKASFLSRKKNTKIKPKQPKIKKKTKLERKRENTRIENAKGKEIRPLPFPWAKPTWAGLAPPH